VERQTAQEIEAEAFQWVMALDRRDDPRTGKRLEAWLTGDARRQGAFLKAQATWAAMDGLDEDARPPIAPPLTPAARAPTRGVGRRGMLFGGGGLAACLVLGAGLLLRPEVYRTARGEQRTTPLSDGSTARINTDSALSVAMSRGERVVRLRDGEAWFKVAHDKARPFRVEAGSLAVQATGTAFAVRRKENGVEVLVTEGSVDVWRSEAPATKVALKAGQSLFALDAAASVAEASVLSDPAEISRRLAWRDGRIELDGERLDFAVAEFNRYNRVQLLAPDQVLAAERLYGGFSLDDPEGFARAVQLSLHASIRRSGPDEIELSRAPAAAPEKNSPTT
jgi:transmembrane sensor